MVQSYRLVSLVCAVLVLLSTAVAPIAAQEGADQPLTEQSTYEAFSGIVDEYNAQQSENVYEQDYGDSVGVGVLKYFLAGERVNVYVTDTETDDVEEFSFFVREDLIIKDLEAEKHADATARVDVRRATVEDIMRADDPLMRLKWHLFEGHIDIRGEQGDAADQLAWTLVKSGAYEVRKQWYYYQVAREVLGGDLEYSDWQPLW